MDFWTAVVLIVAIGCFTWMRAKRHAPVARGTAPSAPNGDLEREVVRLRQRIEVLERLATDRRPERDLAREIEALRD